MHTGTSHGILYTYTNYTTILKRIRVTAGEKKCPYGGKGYKDLVMITGVREERTNGFFNTKG